MTPAPHYSVLSILTGIEEWAGKDNKATSQHFGFLGRLGSRQDYLHRTKRRDLVVSDCEAAGLDVSWVWGPRRFPHVQLQASHCQQSSATQTWPFTRISFSSSEKSLILTDSEGGEGFLFCGESQDLRMQEILGCAALPKMLKRDSLITSVECYSPRPVQSLHGLH